MTPDILIGAAVVENIKFKLTQKQVHHFFVEKGLEEAKKDPDQKGKPGFMLDKDARICVIPTPIHTAHSFDNAHGMLDNNTAATKDVKLESNKKKSSAPTAGKDAGNDAGNDAGKDDANPVGVALAIADAITATEKKPEPVAKKNGCFPDLTSCLPI
jgi:hypothetical protein